MSFGIDGTDVRITVFLDSLRVKTATLSKTVKIKMTGKPRLRGHAIEVKVTDEPNDEYDGHEPAPYDYIIARDGTVRDDEYPSIQ